MAIREYIGARYVPKFMGNYSPTTQYEALSVVEDGLGTSYTSKKPVPAGTPLTDTEYWAVTGSMSGAIISLQNRVSFLENEIANVKYYGATGDGVTDDTAAFVSAINSGRPVYVPEGEYVITDYLNIPSDFYLFGQGTILDRKANDQTDPAQERTGLFEIDNQNNIVIQGIKIKGEGSSPSTYLYGCEIHAIDSSEIYVKDVEIMDIKKIFAICFEHSDYCKAENCYIHNYTYGGIVGLINCNNLDVIGCRLIDVTSLTAINTYPIMLNGYPYTVGTPEVVGKNLRAIGNFIDNPTSGAYWEGIDSHGGDNIIITDNIIKNVMDGIAIASQANFTSKNVIISDNIVIQGGSGSVGTLNNSGIVVANTSDCIISNNSIEGFGKHTTAANTSGIQIVNSDNVKINGNDIFDCGSGSGFYGICVINGSEIDMSSNYIHDNNLTAAARWSGDINHLTYHDNIIRSSGRMCSGVTSHAAPQDVRSFNNDSDDLLNANNDHYVPQFVHHTAIGDVVNGKVGDIIYNLAPSTGTPVGWICTVAQTNSTPATYKSIGTIA